MCYNWFNMANDLKLWMNLCRYGDNISLASNGLTTGDGFRVDKWQLSPASQLKQLKAHTLPDGRVQVLFIQIGTHTLFSHILV